MSFLVVLVVNHLEQIPAVLDAWEAARAPGITILNSTGLGRVRRGGLLEDMPIIPSLRDLFASDEVHHRTLFSVVNDQAAVDRLVEAAVEALGDLDVPNSGFLFVVPVVQAVGLNRKPAHPSEE